MELVREKPVLIIRKFQIKTMMLIQDAQEVRALAGIVGKAGLTSVDLNYMNFGDEFENKFLYTSN